MFGERLDLGVAPRDSQRAAFARANDEFAQRPQIGAIRERDEFGGVVREEPPLTRAVMKGRSPDEAVATYRAQRAKNNQPVDEVYAAKIRRENASLRADQSKLEEDNAVARIMRQAAGNTDPRIQSEAQFIDESLKPAPKPSRYYDGGNPKYDVATSFSQEYSGPSAADRTPLPDPFSSMSPELAARSPLVGANAVTPPSGEPEPISTDAAVKFASERRKMEQHSTRRQSVIDRLSTRNVRIGGGAAVGAGLLAALGISNSRNPEEQYQ